ncbi:hypothetical protein EGR_03266 [Echinococcus granulosus]|uniref:Expressed conserved protein n=1 Tax=Echinococcus granulosus TaxID=6210 RepID=U6J7N4_ECHGR|nr:hypothetical protein EGR_03266 [Echinococcus granulosus]EUB61993.1 hypothetical protein EGR_03266 [Echinococcus granulosus]CDS17752.1 expressed conserved protein [Echinococcus granulosus]
MHHFSCVFLFVAALANSTPMSPPHPGFTEVEQRMITGLLEKHELRDIIRVMLMVEERRFVKEPTAPPSKVRETTIMGSVPRPGLPISKDYELAMPKKEVTTPPPFPRRRFYDEDVWQQTMAEI